MVKVSEEMRNKLDQTAAEIIKRQDYVIAHDLVAEHPTMSLMSAATYLSWNYDTFKAYKPIPTDRDGHPTGKRVMAYVMDEDKFPDRIDLTGKPTK